MRLLGSILLLAVALHAQIGGGGGGGVIGPSTNGAAYWNGSALTTTGTGGAGTLCLTSVNGGAPAFGSCSGSSSVVWSNFTNPTGNLSLSMGNNTTTWTAGTATTAPFLIQDTTGNTGTGSLLQISTIGTSTELPITITAQGTANGVQMSTAGVLAPLGTGHINSDQANGGAWPTSAAAVATNGSKQPVAAATSGTGSTLALTGSPTFTGTITAAALTLSGNLTTNVTGGGTQCLQVSNAGLVTGTGGACLTSSNAAWSAITNPSGNLSLTMAANTTTFTWNAATGAGVNLFTITDTTNNTGTGTALIVNLASGSAAKPFEAAVNGNGVAVSNAGVLAALGTGHVNADQCSGNTCVQTSVTMTANLPLFGNGGSTVVMGTRTGNTTQVATSTGTQTSTAIVNIDSNGNHVATGCTIDSNNNLSCPGSVTGGAASNKTGAICMNGATSGSQCLTVADVAGSQIAYLIPAATGNGKFLQDNGSTTCPTFAAGGPTVCEQLAWANPAGAGTITSSSSGQVPVYTAATTIAGGADFTFATGTLTLGTAGSELGVIKFSGSSSGTTTVQPAAAAGGTLTWPAATGTIVEDSATLTAGGLIYGLGNHALAATSAFTSKQVCLSGGAGAPTCIDFPDKSVIPFAQCNNTTAGTGLALPATGFTPVCRAGTNNILGALQAIPNSANGVAYFDFELPVDWDTSDQPRLNIFYGSGANTSGTVIWTVSTACSKADGSVSDDPAFNANSAFATQTMAVANRGWSQTGQLTTVTSGNNCVPGSNMIVKLALTGTATSAINAYKAVVEVSRLLTVQAE